MARSGTHSFSLDRDTIIKRAMQLVNIININQTARGSDQEYAVDIFQSMIKLWQAEGIQLWNRRQAVLFPAYQDEQYSISLTGDHCTNSYINTTLSADEAAAQTVLSVTSSTGMTAADRIGIELDDGTRQWTTIVSVDSSIQITVTAALTGAAANVPLGCPAPVVRLSLSGTTTVYLVGQVSFAVSTLTGTGRLEARRLR